MDRIEQLKKEKAELIMSIKSLIDGFTARNKDVSIDKIELGMKKFRTEQNECIQIVTDVIIDIKI